MYGKTAASTIRITSLVTQENIRWDAVGIRVTSIPVERIAQGLHVAEFGHAGSLCPRVSDCTVLLRGVIADIGYYIYLGATRRGVIKAIRHPVEVIIRPRNTHIIPLRTGT